MPAPARVLSAAALALSMHALACDNPNPGTPLGTYSVASSVASNTCGATGNASDPGAFDVTLSNDQGVIYWFPTTGGAATSGDLSAAGTVSVSEVVADNVDGADGGMGPCTLERTDTLAFTLAKGSTPTTFTGSYSFVVSAAAGANCNDQLAAHGGVYPTLPCTTTYSLAGTRQ